MLLKGASLQSLTSKVVVRVPAWFCAAAGEGSDGSPTQPANTYLLTDEVMENDDPAETINDGAASGPSLRGPRVDCAKKNALRHGAHSAQHAAAQVR